jgi:hypothetical protein
VTRSVPVALACVLAVLALLTSTASARAEGEPASIAVHSDGTDGPLAPALTRFFTTGEPLAYVDWLCLGTEADVGPFLDLELARLTALDQDGAVLGHFTTQSGARHRFRPFHGASGHRYCTRVLPRAWTDDSVRFVAARDAARVTRVTFALDGDSRGCRGGGPCGALAPRLTGFAYGSAAARFTYGSLGFWRSAELDGGELGIGVTRLRAAAFVPLLYITAGSPTSLRFSVQAGVALPVTIASTELRDGGSALGTGIGAYWAQCLELRTPVAPNLCAGAEIDGAVEGALRGGALDDVRPRMIFAWYVALGLGR